MKRLLSLFAVAAALLLCLSACGGGPDPEPKGEYEITFVMDTKQVTKYYDWDEVPVPPKAPSGWTIIGWDYSIGPVHGDMTYTAAMTRGETVPPNILKAALAEPLITHRKDALGNVTMNCPTEYWNGCTATFVLALEEYENPQANLVRDRIIEQLGRVTVGGGEPIIDNHPIWWTPSLTAAIALARITPTVWDDLTPTVKERLDLIMSAFVCVEAFGTADWNDFHTGPGLKGDYRRDWNVNYALANISPIINAVVYFGADDEGGFDWKRGSDAVNAIIKAFDYDTYVAKFAEYKWKVLTDLWCFRPDDQRALMMEGTDCALRADSPSGNRAGPGAGVRPPKGYDEFTYHTWTLAEVEKIVDWNFEWCFGGGPVTQGGSDGRGYTINGAYDNPMLGKQGMFAEMNQGSRSSIGYSVKDFIMFSVEMTFLDTLGIYTAENHHAIMELASVGMGDIIYKYKMGYHSWASATNMAGSDDYESNYGGYYFARALWMTRFDDTMMYLFPDGLY